jgi:isocitrate lyase
MIELPPLPYGASPAYGYTEAEMRAYGEACARAAIEAAAVCGRETQQAGSEYVDHAIRALAKP